MSESPRESKVVVLGAGGTGIQIAEVIERTAGLRFEGFLDDDPSKRPEHCCGYAVLGPLCHWPRLPQDCLFVSSLYGARKTPHFSGLVRSLRIPDARWATVIDARATVSRLASIGPGCFVGPGCVIQPGVKIGTRCSLLANVYLAHDTRLGEYVACGNSASLAGGVSVGDASFVGANATVREYTTIGKNAVVGMGSVVLNDVADGQTVAGNPARPLPVDSASARVLPNT